MSIINTVYMGDKSHLTPVSPDKPNGNFAGFAVNKLLKRLFCLECGALVAPGQTALNKHLKQEQHKQTTVPRGYQYWVARSVKSMPANQFQHAPALDDLPAESVPVQGARIVAAWRCEGCKRLETVKEAMLSHLEKCARFEGEFTQRIATPVLAQRLSSTVVVEVQGVAPGQVQSVAHDPAATLIERLLRPQAVGVASGGPRECSGLVRSLGANIAADERLRNLTAAQRVACEGRDVEGNYKKLHRAVLRYLVGVGLSIYALSYGMRICILEPSVEGNGHAGPRRGRAFAPLQDMWSYKQYASHVAGLLWSMLRLPGHEWTDGWERLLPDIAELRAAFSVGAPQPEDEHGQSEEGDAGLAGHGNDPADADNDWDFGADWHVDDVGGLAWQAEVAMDDDEDDDDDDEEEEEEEEDL